MCLKCGFRAETFELSGSCLEARDELFGYTLTLPRPPFIHQLAVDAYGAQHLDEDDSAITRLFPLMGLYMVCEQGASGFDVQIAHMRKSRDPDRNSWPVVEIHPATFSVNIGHFVVAEDRELAIEQWVRSTWNSYGYLRDVIARFCE